MKIRRGIFTIMIVSMLVSIAFGVVNAVESTMSVHKNELFTIEIGAINEYDNSIIETASLTAEQINQLEMILSDVINNIESANNWGEIGIRLDNYAKNFLHEKGIIFNIIKRIIRFIENIVYLSILKSKWSKWLSGNNFVISVGHSYKFNIFKTSQLMRLHKNLCIWHYSKGLTLIWKSNIHKVLKDLQLGFMSNFNGIYVFIARKFPQKCFTFFVGIPRMTNAVSLSFGN
jgi:hypothetical protein